MYSTTQSPSANGREVNEEKDKVLSNISHLTQQLHFSSFLEEPQLRYVHGSLVPNFRSVLQTPSAVQPPCMRQLTAFTLM
jgi:hypothetical protein